MASIMLNILLLSNEEKMVLEMLAFSVEESLHDVSIGILEASTRDDAMEVLEFNSVDLIIADMNIDTIESYKFYDELQALHKFTDIPFVFLSSNLEDQEIAILKGVQNFFLKPLNIDQLLERVTDILKIQKREKEAFILPVEDDFEHEIHHQTLKEILEISQNIDTLIQNDAPLIQIQQENQKIMNHIHQLLTSSLLLDETI